MTLMDLSSLIWFFPFLKHKKAILWKEAQIIFFAILFISLLLNVVKIYLSSLKLSMIILPNINLLVSAFQAP